MKGEYPNLEMLTRGCVSGRLSEWPRLKTEAARMLAELAQLRGVAIEARDHLHTKQDMDRVRQLAYDALQGIA